MEIETCCGRAYKKDGRMYCSNCHKLLYGGLQSEGINFGDGRSAKSCRNTGLKVKDATFPKDFSSYKRERVNKIVKETSTEFPFIPQSILDIMRQVIIQVMHQYYMHTGKKQQMIMLFLFHKLLYTKTAFLNERIFYLDKLFYNKVGLDNFGQSISKSGKAKNVYAEARKRGIMLLEVCEIDLGTEHYVPSFPEICSFYRDKYITKYIQRYHCDTNDYTHPDSTQFHNILYHTYNKMTRQLQVAAYLYICIAHMKEYNANRKSDLCSAVIEHSERRMRRYLRKTDIGWMPKIKTLSTNIITASDNLSRRQRELPYKIFCVQELLGNDMFDRASALYNADGQ